MRSRRVADVVPLATEPPPRKQRRQDRRAARRESGAWFPRWYWPSLSTPAAIWLILFFAVPLYVVVAVAFGASGPIFGEPLPVYEPWYWSTSAFSQVLSRFFGPAAFWQPSLIRTFIYVGIASLICVVVGFLVAYYVARYGGKRKALYLVLLVAPFWISYLMRIFAWQSLLAPFGYVNDVLVFLHITPTRVDWLDGKPITVILSLVYGYIPYMILPIYGGIDRMNLSLLEASRDLGAGPFRTFMRVTIPVSKQAILAGAVIVSLPMFGDYYTNNLMGSTSTSMYGNLIDKAINQPNQGPRAGVLVLLLMLILLVPMAYYLRSTRRAAEGLD
jgi:ABC-type spermidine/putrescine transport system permease subunit I